MRPLIACFVSALLLSCVAGLVTGQASPPPGPISAKGQALSKARPVPDAPRPPQLVARDGEASKTLALAKADIHVAIAGYLAQTTLVMTFSNDAPRVLEGELAFPLPENATVSGYGIDVNGEMVDGVPVDKLKARVTYEKEIRRRVDPGLVEQTEGNNFRTRVYPIPAHGTRTVKVQYVSDLTDTPEGLAYSLPLNWGQAVGECTIHLEVNNASAAPVVRGGAGELSFKHWEDRYIAEQTLHDVNFNADLLVSLPQVPRQQAVVEKRVKETQSVDSLIEGKADKDLGRSEYYFTINDRPPVINAIDQLAKKPQRIGILWDASLHRAEGDKGRELALIRSLLAKMDAGAADVTAFRNVAGSTSEFQITGGNADEVIHYLQTLTYDGGDNIGTLNAPGRSNVLGDASSAPAQYDYWLLCTDGLADLGPQVPHMEAPVYTISNSSRVNSALLHRIAAESGGAYLNLQRMTNEQAAQSIGATPFSLVGVDFTPGQVSDIYPRGTVPALGRVSVTGKLLVPEAKVTLKYGFGAAVTGQVEVTLKQQGAGETGLVPRYRAQQKLADLSSDVEGNAEALSAVGREFGLVTPNTSLLVLETVQQYLEHRIVPPRSRKDVYDPFMAQIEQQKTQHQQSREERLAQVMSLWNGRVQWWEGKHEYAKDFKYKQPQNAPVAAGGFVDAGGAATTQPGPQARGYDRPPNLSLASGGAAAADPAPGAAPASGWHVLRQSLQPAHGEARAADEARRYEQAEMQRARPARPVAVDQAGQRPSSATAEQAGELGAGGALAPAPYQDILRYPRNYPDISEIRDASVSVERGLKKSLADKDSAAPDFPAAIAIKQWDPNTPYLAAMRAVAPDKAYAVYLQQRASYAASPAFYLDCGDYLLRIGQHEMGVRVLTNILELKLDSAPLLRVAAGRLAQTGDAGDRDLAIELYEKVLKMRPDEPQSHRDLALALADRADALMALSPSGADEPRALADYQRSLELLNAVVMGQWDNRFAEIELPALMEANRLIARVARLPHGSEIGSPLDPRLVKLLDLDVRVVLQWDADNTDVDLWVTEPSGEKCMYDHNRTVIGGLLSRDFTQGYGPEEYCLRHAMPGTYKVQANYYGSSQVTLAGPTTVQATVITHFGRPDEKRRCLTIRLAVQKDVVDLGVITLGAGEN